MEKRLNLELQVPGINERLVMKCMDRLITIKSNRYGVELRLDPDAPFQELCDAAYTRFRESVKFFRGTEHMAICFSGRVLTDAEEGKMIDIITETTGVKIVCIIDQDEQKELTYKSIVEETLANVQKREGQFYRGTLGRRQVLESDSSIVVLGDVELGARVIAKGNIVIVGGLYGSAHAGVPYNRDAYIVSLSMQPKRLSIGDIEAKRQFVYQESLTIKGPKIAVVDGMHIYLDPLLE